MPKTDKFGAFARWCAFPLVLSLLYLYFAVRNATGTPYWFDEIASILFLRDDSLSHMLDANRDAINVVPPLYFLLGWGYAHLFGVSEMSLRLFSGILLILAVWVAWFFLLRRFGLLPAIVAICGVFLSHLLLLRGYEVRYYSFYLLVCLIAVVQYDNLMRKPRVEMGGMAGLFVMQLLVCFTHLFGLLVGGCVILADFVSRWLRERSLKAAINGRIIAPVVLAWVVFALLWGATTKQQAAAFTGHLWIDRPNIPTAVRFFFGNSVTIIGATVVLVLANLLAWRTRLLKAIAENAGDRLPLLVLSVTLLIVPLSFVYVFSTVSSFSGFLFRYMYYIYAAWLPLLAFGTELVLRALESGAVYRTVAVRFGSPRVSTVISAAACVIAIVLLGLAAKRGMAGPTFEKSNDWLETVIKTANAPEGLPVLVTDQHLYYAATYYAPKPTRYFYPQDKEYAENSGTGTGYNVVAYVIQEAVLRHYPDPNTTDWDTFVNAHDRFIVIDFNAQGTPRWPEYRLKKDARFRVIELDKDGAVLLVEKASAQ